MVRTRSGLSTENISQNNLDMLTTISILTELYHDNTTVSNLYEQYTKLSPSNRKKFIKDIYYEYHLLQTAKTIF